ncbi:Outer membrane protein beta-barrel domain-containing protein [Salegentibacter agarivorans]|uniref:Outer membrane protein beta-barrel domain-containing protein n=1 Tax=Salegentibacter agarivorans TaxID=345907 RepID=A0A1I2QH10_9FLAO|nr:outer membrane beta-barrel protein [Salegentibacter agarivorans]SFG24861.1 Outer membrane protein beta-barrel domain-containing protein [Salegentibacter agarivorans]
MKKILLIAFLLLQISVYSQNNTQWSFGIEFSTDNISFSDERDGIDYIGMEGANAVVVKFDQNNYSLGLTTNYYFGEKLAVSSGFLYSNKDFTGTYNDCILCNVHSSSIPEIIEQRFLVVPISINYSLLTGKLKPVINGGLKNNFAIKNDLDTISKGYFLEAFLGATIYYEIIKNLEAGIGYNYQAAISDFYKTDEFNLRTNSFSFRINYLFK